MTVSQGSRYIASNLVVVDADSSALPDRGSHITIYNPGPPLFSNAQFIRYVVKQGDTFQLLAFQRWGTTADWWRIADMNPQIFYPDNLVPGTVIRMPLL